jgi:hypothetical protein
MCVMASKLTYYPSARKVRGAVVSTQTAVNRQAEAIVTIAGQVRDLQEQVDSLLDRGFFGRLRWIVTGR